MAGRPAPRSMTVISKRRVTPSMMRVTLGGEGMADYPAGQQGGYVKLMLGSHEAGEKPLVRTYTIRGQRAGEGGGEIDLDFALHVGEDGSTGPATQWALSAEPGAPVVLGGPGPAKPLPPGFDHYLIAGDMTALPAISVNLEALPRDARGAAFIEIYSPEDRQALDAPEGVDIHWLVNPAPGIAAVLPGTVRSAPFPGENVYGWVACEFSSMKALREYLRVERGMNSGSLYISSYWKAGLEEDGHRAVKREDAEAMGA